MDRRINLTVKTFCKNSDEATIAIHTQTFPSYIIEEEIQKYHFYVCLSGTKYCNNCDAWFYTGLKHCGEDVLNNINLELASPK